MEGIEEVGWVGLRVGFVGNEVSIGRALVGFIVGDKEINWQEVAPTTEPYPAGQDKQAVEPIALRY